jgi:hypothetical protein
MKHEFERRSFKVTVTPVNLTEPVIAIPKMLRDPYDIEPAFHVRYEDVKIGPHINLKALKKNYYMFKLQAKEAATDPKRVVRRQLHKRLQEKRREQRMRDSFLFA